jgi:hypothetical protein
MQISSSILHFFRMLLFIFFNNSSELLFGVLCISENGEPFGDLWAW